MSEATYEAMRAYINVAVELEVKKALASDTRSSEVRTVEGPAGKDGRDGVDGKDGADGKDAVLDVDVLAKEVGALMPLAKDVMALIPVPRDGRDGIASLDEVKAIAEKAVDDRLEAEVQKRVAEVFAALPALQYRGVFRAGESYRKGNFATFGGSVWHANEDTTDKPGEGSKSWTLAVKHGSPGKDATR